MGVAARSCQRDGNSLHGSVAGVGQLRYGKTHDERYRQYQTVVPESCSRHRNSCLQKVIQIPWVGSSSCRTCEAPVRLGCTVPLLNVFMGRRRGSHRLPVAFYGTSTMSDFMGPSTERSSFFSLAGTLNVSNALTRSSTRALKAAVVIFMPACVFFMSGPS